MRTRLFFLLSTLLVFYANAAVPKAISGENLITSAAASIPTQTAGKKGVVVIFVSAKCPCSDSHVAILKNLVKKYPDFKFVGVHSNSDEPVEMSRKYFKTAGLPFEVIQDNKNVLADQLEAYKTPHAFVINAAGEILYQGGVTNSSHGGSADKILLDEALDDVSRNRKVRTPEGRTLGCVILRDSEVR